MNTVCRSLLTYLGACCVIPAIVATGADTAKRPNVLFIGVDDLNTKIGCYGASYIQTPNIDRLAARGVRFERAYCQYPVCNASRTSLLSGLYPERTRVFGNNQDPREMLPDAVLLPELFRQNGYFTAGIGKIAHGRFTGAVHWDVAENPRDSGDGDDEEGGKRRKQQGGAAQRRAAARQAAAPDALPFGWRATDHEDDEEPDGQIARSVVRLIEEHRDGPFFIAAGFHKPHTAHVAPRKYFDFYPPRLMPLATRGGDPVPPLAATKYYPELSDDQQRQIIAHYSAVTTFMDSQLGRVLATVDRLGLWQNTIVVFWSDHGWHHGEHGGAWAKFTVLQESARVPLIVAGPSIEPATASGLVELVDLYPTLAQLCGLDAPSGLAGSSFAPLLEDPTGSGKEVAYTVVQRGRRLARSVRAADYAYIEYPDGARQLFAASDVEELHNLSDDRAHAGALERMRQLLERTSQRAAAVAEPAGS